MGKSEYFGLLTAIYVASAIPKWARLCFAVFYVVARIGAGMVGHA